MLLSELQDRHPIDGAEFIVDRPPLAACHLFELGMHFRHKTHDDCNPVESILQEIKRHTAQFYNIFSRASPETAKEWSKAPSWALNQPI